MLRLRCERISVTRGVHERESSNAHVEPFSTGKKLFVLTTTIETRTAIARVFLIRVIVAIPPIVRPACSAFPWRIWTASSPNPPAAERRTKMLSREIRARRFSREEQIQNSIRACRKTIFVFASRQQQNNINKMSKTRECHVSGFNRVTCS